MIIVRKTLDIVFSEIIACLNLNEDQIHGSRVHDAMGCALGNIDGLPGRKGNGLIVQGHNSLTGYDIPMLGPVSVPLKA
jgi:hypothetical protein